MSYCRSRGFCIIYIKYCQSTVSPFEWALKIKQFVLKEKFSDLHGYGSDQNTVGFTFNGRVTIYRREIDLLDLWLKRLYVPKQISTIALFTEEAPTVLHSYPKNVLHALYNRAVWRDLQVQFQYYWEQKAASHTYPAKNGIWSLSRSTTYASWLETISV